MKGVFESDKDPQSQHSEFLKYFPEATLENVEVSQIPPGITKIFEWGWMIDPATIDQEKFEPRKWKPFF